MAALAVVVWTAAAASEPLICQDCHLGVYDDLAMTRSTGTVSIFQIKSVYLGVRLASGVQVDQLDFEATYPAGFTVVDVTPYLSGATYNVGDNRAHVQWPQCVTGVRALFRVRVLTVTSVRNGLVQLRNVVARGCGNGTTASWLMPSGCYVLNPSGPTRPCATGATPVTWTIVKELFRSIDSR
jgi:hypothetical protein